MKKFLFIPVLIITSIISFAQSPTLIQFQPVNPIEERLLLPVETFPPLILDRQFTYKAAIGKMPFKIVSLTEIEEVRVRSIIETNGKVLYFVRMIKHDYGNWSRKYAVTFKYTYIDSRDGLLFDRVECTEGERLY